jgi:transcriptional regulator with XRE-family HTH domain
MRNVTVYLVHFVNQLGAFLLAVFLFLWSELRDKRKRTGLTIEQAAERCGVDPSTYARWERGVQLPHPRNLQTLMEVIDPYDDVWYAENTWVPDAWLPPSYWND